MENNPYGIAALWAQGDLVTRGIALALLLMSVASWYVMLTRAWRLMRNRRLAQTATGQFWPRRAVVIEIHEDFHRWTIAGCIAGTHSAEKLTALKVQQSVSRL